MKKLLSPARGVIAAALIAGLAIPAQAQLRQGVKLRAGQLDLDAVFARIDSMPMRRREMRRDAASDPRERGDSI